jgi:hypothetical protein
VGNGGIEPMMQEGRPSCAGLYVRPRLCAVDHTNDTVTQPAATAFLSQRPEAAAGHLTGSVNIGSGSSPQKSIDVFNRRTDEADTMLQQEPGSQQVEFVTQPVWIRTGDLAAEPFGSPVITPTLWSRTVRRRRH